MLQAHQEVLNKKREYPISQWSNLHQQYTYIAGLKLLLEEIEDIDLSNYVNITQPLTHGQTYFYKYRKNNQLKQKVYHGEDILLETKIDNQIFYNFRIFVKKVKNFKKSEKWKK